MNNKIAILLFSATTLLFASSAFAFYTVQDTGDLLAPDQMAVGASLQGMTAGPVHGVNILGHLDKGLTDTSNLRFEAGSGATDAVLGGYYKWVPFPDYQDQPAVGFIMGGQYAHYQGAGEIAARFTPIASKKFEIHSDQANGTITPYVALPIAIANYNSSTLFPVQITLGAKYHDDRVKVCDFLAELDFDVNQAPNSIVLGVQFAPF